jgi:hypothetical protein
MLAETRMLTDTRLATDTRTLTAASERRNSHFSHILRVS